MVVELGKDGYVSLYNHSAKVHLVADVVGYFEARNVQDAPDEIVGPQIHIVHVVPSDVAMQYGDAEILHTLSVAESWLEEHGGRGFRFDTSGGIPEISTLHVAKSTADFEAAYPDDWYTASKWIVADGFGSGGKAYVVFLDGVSVFPTCGVAADFAIATVFTSYSAGAKGSVPNSTGNWTTLRATRTTVHELLHVLGAVSRCAPDFFAAGHVSDQSDVMYPVDQNDEGDLLAGAYSVLDAGHDDYWGQGNSTCNGGEPWPDVSLSPYLDAPQ